VIYGLIEAEELGIKNIDSLRIAKTGGQAPARIEGDLGKGLGLPNDFVARAVRE